MSNLYNTEMDNKIVKTELFDVNVMESLASHDGVSVDTKAILKSYKKKREDGNKVQVIYEYGKDVKKLGLGRLYPQKGLGLQNLPGDVRSALAQRYYHDIDMENSQPRLLVQICDKNGWLCDNLKSYVANRSEYLQNIMEHKKCDRETAKQLCLMVMFGGKPFEVPKCLKLIINEIEKISQNVIGKYPEIYTACKKKDNPKASTLAHVLQDAEFKILRQIDLCLQTRGRSMDVFIHDGGLVRKIDDEKEFPIEILAEIEKEIKDITGYEIKLAEKPLQHSFEFKKDTMRMTYVTEKEYQQRKEEFEVDHFYCNETSTICSEVEESLIHTSKIDARVSFARYSFQKTVDNTIRTISFITEWLNDPMKRMINKLVFQPDRTIELKEDDYNLFKGFKGEYYDGLITEKDAILERFLLLVNQNSNKKQEVIDYMIKWFALLVQKPTSIPGVAIVLINTSHGTGKDTLADFIGSKVVGDNYAKTIINVETQLFDTHSIAFDKTLFMKLEEVNGNANRKFSDMLKSMITGTKATINPKGTKKYETNVYPHIMMTTNNVTPVKIEPNDRRFCISYTASDYEGNHSFWKETQRLFLLPEAGHIIYQYLMSIDLTDFVVQKFPKTEYHKSLALMETPSEILYLQECQAFNDRDSSTLYEDYKDYCGEQHLQPKSLVGFGRSLSPLIEKGLLIRRMLQGKSFYSKP